MWASLHFTVFELFYLGDFTVNRLSSRLLKTFIPRADIEVPNYGRRQIKLGIVHFGPGNFSLAHITAKTHDLMQSGDRNAMDYGIVAVSIPSPSRREQLGPQDGLYTIAELDAGGRNKMTVVGSILRAFYAPEDQRDVAASLASPYTRVVSMTITPQAHQSYMTAQGNLNLIHPDIAHDLNPASAPKTIFGHIARGIQAREAAQLPRHRYTGIQSEHY